MKNLLQSLLTSLSRNAGNMPFDVSLWDGTRLSFGEGAPRFHLNLKSKSALRDVISRGTIGFGEQYMQGGIDVEGALEDLFRLGVDPSYQALAPPPFSRILGGFGRMIRRGSIRKAPENIAHHYDRGNEFFSLWLDASMTYSCAYFKNDNDTLEQAQDQKHDHLCRKLLLRKGETLADIGCGWGGMLFYAAKKYGVRGVGCTLSRNQFDSVKKKVQEEGLEGMVEVHYMDYREMPGPFDKFVSVGMFEHVGKNYIPTFMQKARELLRSGGLGVLHTIGKERESKVNEWTFKYIFPGGYIPTIHETLRELARAGLESLDVENLRLHYAKTLDAWAARFESNVGQIRNQFGDPFVRMWRMFLVGSAAGFRYGDSRLYQITFSNGVNNALPMTRGHLYS